MGMMKSLPIFLGFLLFCRAEASCELKSREPLRIGCTYDCGPLYRLRLTLNALALGYPLEIINLTQHQDISEALSSVDGVLIPGGADIHPDLYISKLSPELQSEFEKKRHLAILTDEGRERDPFESELVKTYSRNDSYKELPLLGICRGMQMMTVAEGIPLYLDLKTELGLENRRYVMDEIHLKAGGLMREIHGKGKLRAMKLHHQGLHLEHYLKHQDQYPQVRVTSTSHDQRIAESLELTHRPAIGVQYHPEMSFTSASAPLFKWFLVKSCEYKNRDKGI